MRNLRIAALILAVALLAAMATTPALAAKGGNGGGNDAPAATLTVSPDPVSAWGGVYAVNGSGFKPDKVVSINTADPGCCLAFDVWADSSGNVSFSRMAAAPGTYRIEAYQRSGRKLVLMGTVNFRVVEQ